MLKGAARKSGHVNIVGTSVFNIFIGHVEVEHAYVKGVSHFCFLLPLITIWKNAL